MFRQVKSVNSIEQNTAAGPGGTRFDAPAQPVADDRSVFDALGFGASLLLAWGGLHLMVLASRSALNGLLHASVESVAILALACLVLRNRPQARIKLAGSLLLAIGGALTIAFSLVYQPAARGLLFVLQQGCAGGALACWTLRVLSEAGLRQELTACGGGCAGSGALGVVLYAVASPLGLVGNVVSYTTLALVVYGLAALVVAIATIAWKPAGSDQSRPYGGASRGPAGYDESSPYGELTAGLGGSPAQPAAMRAQIAMFGAVCLAGVAASFFDGVTFNPYVHDMLSITLIANLVCTIGGILLVACARLRNARRVAPAMFGCVALFLGVAILGIALVSASLEGAGLPIGIVEGSSVLLLCAAVSHLASFERLNVHLVIAALACCSTPWAICCGLAVKRTVGYSLSTITPIVLVAIAVLSIASLVLNAQSARSISSMQEGYENELSRQQLDFEAERDAAKRRTAVQIERERKTRERAVQAARQEIIDRTPKETAEERYVAMLVERGLTEREVDVVMVAIQGHTIQDIGSELGIAKQTVNYHLHNIYAKLGVVSKSEMLKMVHAAAHEGVEADEQDT